MPSSAHREPPSPFSKWLWVSRIIAATTRNRIRLLRGNIDDAGGATHQRRSIAQSIAYLRQVFADYLFFGGLNTNSLPRKTILELGPGDNLGVLLLFLANGSGPSACLDRFYSQRDTDHERSIYRALRQQFPLEHRARFDAAVQIDPTLVFNPDQLRAVYGIGAQEADKALEGRQFDLILSRAVLEEVADLDGAFAAMHRLLKPGGMLLHKIDLSDYGIFADRGFHAREMLTIPDPVYRWMTCDGRLNRRMLDYYRSKMRELGYSAKFHFTEILDGNSYRNVIPPKTHLEPGVDYDDEAVSQIREIRPRLACRFRPLTDEELLAAGVFLVAVKPLP